MQQDMRQPEVVTCVAVLPRKGRRKAGVWQTNEP